MPNHKTNNPTSEGMSLDTTSDSFFRNTTVPDDLFDCRENFDYVKMFQERVLKILDDVRQRPCRVLDTDDCLGLSDDEDDDDDDEDELLEKMMQQRLQQIKNSLHQKQQRSHSVPQQHLQQHSSHLQQHHSQYQPCPPQQQQLSQYYEPCPPQQQQHSQYLSRSPQQQQLSQYYEPCPPQQQQMSQHMSRSAQQQQHSSYKPCPPKQQQISQRYEPRSAQQQQHSPQKPCPPQQQEHSQNYEPRSPQQQQYSQHKSRSPQRQQRSQRKPRSPQDKPPSPQDTPRSPQHKPRSPQRKSRSPRHKPRSPQHKSPSPQQQELSQRKSRSQRRRRSQHYEPFSPQQEQDLQRHSLQHQSYKQKQQSPPRQQEQLHRQMCEPDNDKEAKFLFSAPYGRIENLGYVPQSNFMKKLKRQAEVNNIGGPLLDYECTCCVPSEIHIKNQFLCPCCTCNPSDNDVQNVPIGRPQNRQRSRPYSEISSMHDPCTCFRTWRTVPCEEHFPEDQYDNFERDDISRGDAQVRDFSNDRDDGFVRKTPRKKKEKSGHVSRVDKTRRRSAQRRSVRSKSKADEKGSVPSDKDFSPSLKRPHPDSCERCWRYASPSRSPVNRPNQRFDPNYRRSHSEVNTNSESRGNASKSSSRYSSPNRVDFDTETRVRESRSVDRYPTRRKSADNVKRSKRSASAKSHKKAPRRKNDVEGPQTKEELYQAPVQKLRKNQNRSNFNEGSRENIEDGGQDPMPYAPSKFDKKRQRSDVKMSTFNRLPSSACCCKENIRMKPRPLSASQTEKSEEFGNARAHSFDRSCLKQYTHISPGRWRTCCCTKPRQRTVNMNVMCDQPFFCNGDKHCFTGVKDVFGVENDRQNLLGCNIPCSWHIDIFPRTCSFNDLPRSEFREDWARCCCMDVPITLWDRRAVLKDGSETSGKGNVGKKRNGLRRDEKINPRKYCVFYMNKNEENEKDGVEVLIEELTEGRMGKGSERESSKHRTKKKHESRSDSMALRFQKGIPEKCRNHGNNRVSYF